MNDGKKLRLLQASIYQEMANLCLDRATAHNETAEKLSHFNGFDIETQINRELGQTDAYMDMADLMTNRLGEILGIIENCYS